MKRIVRILVPLAILASVAVWLGKSGRLGHHKPPAELTLYGNVDIRQVEIGFRVSGRVASMKVDEGQAVAAGTLLAELDWRSYEDEVRVAEAQVAQQLAALTKLKHGPRSAEIEQARAVVAERNAAFDDASTSLHRMERLRSSDAIPQANLDTAKATADRAQANVSSAAQALRLLEQGSRSEDIAAGGAALDTARARLASAQTALADARLVAPADGIILSRVVEPGAIVGPNNVVYVLSLTRPVYVRAYVGEPQLGRIWPGMQVNVFTDSAPNRPHRGHIGFISPVAEFTPKSVETPELRTALVYRLRIIVDEPGESLRQGMPVTVRVAPPRPAS
jgi:HlyD family secretion protein